MNSSRFTSTEDAKKLSDAISLLDLMQQLSGNIPLDTKLDTSYLVGFSKALLGLISGGSLSDISNILKEHFITVEEARDLKHSSDGFFRNEQYLREYLVALIGDLRDAASDIEDQLNV